MFFYFLDNLLHFAVVHKELLNFGVDQFLGVTHKFPASFELSIIIKRAFDILISFDDSRLENCQLLIHTSKEQFLGSNSFLILPGFIYNPFYLDIFS